MGITGLLPMLKDVTDRVHLSKYEGKTLGIDAYVWLHRGAYGCAEALALGRYTDAYVRYAMGKVNMLKHHGVKPFVVFDGDRLPAKARTEDDRRQRRDESRAKARQLTEMGKRSAAREHYVRCVDVTPAMAFQLIKALRAADVDYIVAPYEADAQLAFMERRGLIDGVISEDSDLLVFGCKRVLYKLRDDGYCDEVLHERRSQCSSLALHAFSDDMFRQMAILSGCDYLPSLPKMGLKTANEMLRKYTTVAQILAVVASKGIQIPEGYRAAFQRAEKTFVYQRVFDRKEDGTIRITTLTRQTNNGDEEEDECIGPVMGDDVAHGIAYGDLDPITRQPVEDLAVLAGRESKGASSFKSMSADNSTSKSFYDQTKQLGPRSRGRKAISAPSRVNTHDQPKVSSFFSKSAGGPLKKASISARQSPERLPLKNRDVNKIKQEADRERKRVRTDSTDPFMEERPPSGKSKFFASKEQANATQSPPMALPCSPEKVYEGSARLAVFSTPTQKQMRKRSNSNYSSDGGLISSPTSSVHLDRAASALDSPTQGDDGIASSSPFTSPTFAMTDGKKLRQAEPLPLLLTEREQEDENMERSNFIDLDRFHFGNAVAPTTGLASALQTPLASITNSVSSARKHASSSSRISLSVKRSLKITSDDGLSDDELTMRGERKQTLPYDSPTNGSVVQEERFAKFAYRRRIDSPKEAVIKRSDSFCRRRRLDLDAAL